MYKRYKIFYNTVIVKIGFKLFVYKLFKVLNLVNKVSGRVLTDQHLKGF